jgi:hypothetical protein
MMHGKTYPDQSAYLAAFEQRLSGALKPVRPQLAFEERLKRRISHLNEVTIESDTRVMSLLAIAGGIILGALLIIVLRKLFSN